MIQQRPTHYFHLRLLKVFAAAILIFSMGCSSNQSLVSVSMYTSEGQIDIVVDTLAAPITTSNFLRYVDAGMYDGGSFFRVVRMDNQPSDSILIEVIQGRANMAFNEQFFDPIPLERTSETGIYHRDGAISMARGGPDTATHSFFFTIGEQTSLDFGGQRNPDGQGFAAFGKVTDGMDVIQVIQQGETEQQTLLVPITIDSVRVN
ncbi:MAG: peptidylprolyl isomerase [Bacteroidetes bacterium]|nr:peptidylprolyl isomerase [Bacteroidota bacterium]MDA1333561.1 peptidylprolyl isomerase [Bacteroidota bacterium]